MQALMHVLVASKNEDNPSKNEGSHIFSYCKSMGIFSDSQGKFTLVQGRICPKFEHIQAFMVVLLTCKNEEDLIKNESARVVTTIYINFSDAQGQITLELAMGSGGNLTHSSFPAVPRYLQECG